MEDKKEDLLRIGNTEASKEKWKNSIAEEVEVWSKWTIRLVEWSLIGMSVWAFWIDHEKILALLYTILAVCIGISNKLYTLTREIKNKEKE